MSAPVPPTLPPTSAAAPASSPAVVRGTVLSLPANVTLAHGQALTGQVVSSGNGQIVLATHLGRIAGRLIGAQLYTETSALLGTGPGGPEAFARFMLRLAAGEGDEAAMATQEDGSVLVRRPGWRLTRGLGTLSPAVFEAWNGLIEGALAVHDRTLAIEVLSRLDWGDDAFVWRIRRRPLSG